MLIGYARVSTDDQDTAAQVAALQAAGCERILREKASGGRWERPQFLRLLNQLRAGDVVVVWKLDQLSRSLCDLLTIMEQLGEVGAGFRSLTEAIDTTTPAGRTRRGPPKDDRTHHEIDRRLRRSGEGFNRAHSLIHAEAEQKRKAGHLRNRVEGRIESLIQGRARSRGHDFSR